MNNNENKFSHDNSLTDNNEKSIDYDLIIDQLQQNFDLEIAKLNTIIKDQDQNIIYLKSDIENIKRNSLKEVQSNINRQMSKVINSFLLVFDDYERSIEYAEKNTNKDILNGLLITYHSFEKALKDLEVIEVEAVKTFDPKLHEAISTIADNTKESNTIAQVIQKGFIYKNQVVRPAKVILYS